MSFHHGFAWKKSVPLALVALSVLSVAADRAGSHCQVPCGIYDDAARIEALREDATTIGKATAQIEELSAQSDAKSINQMTRWIQTKEDHASRIITVVSEYFLTQKVKPVDAGGEGHDAYLQRLADHHAVMVAAMKTKQDVSTDRVHELEQAIDALAKHYQ